MTSFNDLFQRFLDRTGDFLGTEPTDDEGRDLKATLNISIGLVYTAFPWPWRKILSSTPVITDDNGVCFEYPEGEILGVYEDNPFINEDTGNILDDITIFNGKIYMPKDFDGSAAWTLINPPAPYFLGTNPPKIRDDLTEAIIERAVSQKLEQDGQNDKAQVRLARSEMLINDQISKIQNICDNAVSLTKGKL